MSYQNGARHAGPQPPRRVQQASVQPPWRHPALPPRTKPEDMAEKGKIKFFDSKRGFGFIARDGGASDVFLHTSIVTKYGLTERDLEPDVPVRFTLTPQTGGKNPRADAIAVLVT